MIGPWMLVIRTV